MLVKYQHNPFGSRVLVNEMVGSSLARIIKLPIPDYGLCFMSKEVIMETNTNEEIDSNNSGISFYSVLMPNSVPANSGILSAVTNCC